MSHSKGPWETAVNGNEEWDVCLSGGGDMVADLSGCGPNQKANARLIAAAPELLEALKTAVSMLEDSIGEFERFDHTRAEEFQAIINKAEGRIAK